MELRALQVHPSALRTEHRRSTYRAYTRTRRARESTHKLLSVGQRSRARPKCRFGRPKAPEVAGATGESTEVRAETLLPAPPLHTSSAMG